MAKKRTGLQSNISSIFSGVPIPKKGRPDAETPDEKKAEGSNLPKPPTPQPRTAPPKPAMQPVPAAPAVQQPAPSIPVIPASKAPERKVRQVPKKAPRRRKEKALTPRAGASSARQKVSVALVAILSIVLVVVLVKPFGTTRRRAAAPGNTGPARATVSAITNVKIDWLEPPEYPSDLRDPMMAGSQGEIPIQKKDVLIVTAITSGFNEETQEWEPNAVVGTDMLREGDMVPGTTIKVKKINLGGVEPGSIEFEDETGKTWIQKVQAENSSGR